ncbi:response regulator [Mangrovicoccus algicola]|uniref:Response regulator n=1 Tax=Mangrovicoccus algicola TaxID=2771008 RepID=A0A8J6Z9E5_9RHOB|nr:response regulator [Mangrovicoccus algicola]MBE3638411.1 response regulator [Mangrovicoccus algicola]
MSQDINLADQVAAELPYLRRYARALTGSQSSGDQYAVATLEAVLQNASSVTGSSSARVGLYRTFHAIWASSGRHIENDETGRLARAQRRLDHLTAGTREALLLSSIEEFSAVQVAEIMEETPETVEALIEKARDEMADRAAGRVMIIEDETIIAMDLEGIVSGIGHEVTGIARTAKTAVDLGKSDKPDLVLADIHLADDSSGIDAVNELLAHFGELPVIFITAYPERLLTGERPEPAFLIAKPYNEDQVRSAISQALFLSSTEELSF